MFKFDYVAKKDIKEHNQNLLEIPGSPFRILIAASCASGKTNALLNLKNHKQGIDNISLYANDSYKAKYQLLIY